MIEIIKQTEKKKLRYHHGVTKFTGCQCFKDCNCADKFIPEEYNFYSVLRLVNIHKNRYKQSRFDNLLDAGKYYDKLNN